MNCGRKVLQTDFEILVCIEKILQERGSDETGSDIKHLSGGLPVG